MLQITQNKRKIQQRDDQKGKIYESKKKEKENTYIILHIPGGGHVCTYLSMCVGGPACMYV